jgi:NHLM bacteriocin system ABC transporter ATP-binding protein
MNPELRIAWSGAGTPLALRASAPLRLDRGEDCYIVRRGWVDLFAVPLAGGEPAGVRRHLLRLESGSLFAGFPSGEALAVLAVGSLDCEVLEVPRRRLPALPAAELLEQWVRALAACLFGAAPAWPELTLEAGVEITLSAGQRLHAARGLVWALAPAGVLELGGEQGLCAACMPLAEGLGALACAQGQVSGLSTAELLARGRLFEGLDCFHAAVLGPLRALLAEQEAEARRRRDAREDGARGSLEQALGRLAAVADAEHSAPLLAPSGNALADAFGLAAAALGVEVPRRLREQAEAGSLAQLGRGSGVAYRRVLLREDWWRRDNGPLLAWHGESRTPVALLPDGREGYRLHDAGGGRGQAVDAAVAARLDPQAVMLYRPLPARLRSLGELLRFAARGSLRDFLAVAAMGLLGAALAALVPIITGLVFEWVIPQAQLGQLPAVAAGLAVAALAAAAFELSKAVAVLRLEGRMEQMLQPALMQRLLALPVRFFRGYGVGDLGDRLLGVQRIRQLIAGASLVSLLSALFSLVSLVVILFYSVRLALLAALLGLVAMGFTAVLAWAQLRRERAVNELRGREEGLVVQLIQGIAKLRVSGAESRLFAVWAELFAQRQAQALEARRWAGGRELFYAVFPLLCSLLLFLAASRLVAATAEGGGSLSLGGFLAVYAAFGQLLAAMGGMAGALGCALEALPLFERMRPLVEAEPEAQGERNDPGPLRGAIELSRLSFRYLVEGPPVLDEISLRIESGQFVAIVGASGSGKSTLLRLLLGFEAPQSGDILYAGRSIATLDTAALRRRMGVVLQNGRIVTGSIFDNISGGLNYSHDEAWAAARMAGLEADIQAMPMGLHTQLIEGVSTFSGGQYQRLMIARALIGKPQLLLLDEATSALDNTAQAMVMRALDQLRATRVVIAHRLSTVRNADRIFVLERGRLVESGGYEELMARDGAFRELAQRQLA